MEGLRLVFEGTKWKQSAWSLESWNHLLCLAASAACAEIPRTCLISEKNKLEEPEQGYPAHTQHFMASPPAREAIRITCSLGHHKDRAKLLPSYLHETLQKSGSSHGRLLWSMWDSAGVLQVKLKPLWSSSTAYSNISGGEPLPGGLSWQTGRWERWAANRQQLTAWTPLRRIFCT